MAISSPGVGSGLDVNSIVSQLVAIEKQPITTLQTKASTLQSQLSAYGTIKSQVSALQDAATTLATASNWAAQSATSSNTSAVTVTAGATATSTAFGLDVTRLAQAQTTASRSLTTGGFARGWFRYGRTDHPVGELGFYWGWTIFGGVFGGSHGQRQ